MAYESLLRCKFIMNYGDMSPLLKEFAMSNQHKNPTISFHVSEYERKAIEARILASGMMKKDYFVRSCIYNRICVVGKKETIYPLVEVLRKLYLQLSNMHYFIYLRYRVYPSNLRGNLGTSN